ncbi:orc1/cdc6 family replication initiation protein [Halobacterium salinarum]|uniref:ORC1-type DNA replication protein n=1 Tax=Halobacterium salinarum (strain ATCC 33171 / DSM 3754 / JCM 8978 / NBRC 102687 / NCIMB 764 / 91-R6) TaxID=2597657 RepID=A0A4D6GU79_HALS9|nr:orc1/cdc6 family replication initiation protein [Halobacterium salinarum]QCC43988.1 Orc1-type DNA replication protein [Halobacterium salinarum]TYO82483.1 orc1/cdc6 family replication initiation protein [Halobacterium salinarum DSM 3754]
MAGPFSDIDRSIFAAKKILSEDYQPDQILERDEEIDEYRHALEDVLFGRTPQNIMLYGRTGLGKTAVTKYMMDALRKEVAERPDADTLFVHELNCNKKTVYTVVRTLVNDLLPETASKFPKRGLSTADAFEELYNQLDRHGGTHLIVFDEIDHLDDIDTLLYELPRAKSIGHITDSKVGVIGISNNYTFRQELSPKVKDTLMETEISFRPYNASELRTILADRANHAFVDGVCDDSAVARAAAIAAKDRGNARQAIDLLRVGGEVAKRQDDDQVDDSHIIEAQELVQRGRLRNRIRDQTQHAQLLLETLAYLEEQNETPARSKTIKTRYETVADSHAVDPLTTLKSIQNHLSDLHMLGFLQRTDRNRGESGGRYYEYSLDLDPDVVLDIRREIETERDP